VVHVELLAELRRERRRARRDEIDACRLAAAIFLGFGVQLDELIMTGDSSVVA